MSIQWLGDHAEDRADRRRQVVLTEFQLGHVPAFRQTFIDHFAVVGRELPETPGWFRGPTGGLYEVVLTGRSGEPVPAGLEVAALPARFVPLASREVDQEPVGLPGLAARAGRAAVDARGAAPDRGHLPHSGG